MENRKALLVIDMQKGSFTNQTPRFDTNGVVKCINTLAGLFRQMDFPVVFVRHDGNGTGTFERGSHEWELLDNLKVQPGDIMLGKFANDIFYRSGLQAKSSALGIRELLITGCATDFCVEASVQSAHAKDYNVTVVADGHTTAERPHLSAEKVIEHYNRVWQNMIPTKGKVNVENFALIIEKITNTMPH